MPFLEAKAEFTKQLNILRKHSFIVKVQLTQKRHCVQNLQDSEIVLQEDFSENFVMKQQGEMPAQWIQEGTAVFTAVINTKTKIQSYAVISDELCHDKFVVLAFNRAILEHAFVGIKIQKVHFFSNGAGGQFKTATICLQF